MKFKNYFLLCLVAMLAITACKKNGTAKIDTDVYIVGSTLLANGNHAAVYWKNGVMYKLSDTTKNCYGADIAVNGSDVYATGNYIDNNTNDNSTVAYWKNGVETILSVVSLQTAASSIAVSGNNVYVAGTVIDDGGNYAVYWTNTSDMITNLTPGINSSGASKLALSGSDIYIAGHIADTAVYWKNGGVTKLDDTTISNATTIAFNGTNMFIGGVTVASNNYLTATYWNKGKATYLTNGLSDAAVLAITANNNNVYAAGYTTNANYYTVATYWKNGVPITLTDDKTSAELKAITVVGDDVYVTGYTYKDEIYHAVYWKNGVMKSLTGGYDATGIVVITHPHM